MEELIEKISQLGVNLDTDSLVEIARYWFWRGAIDRLFVSMVTILLVGGLLLLIYKAMKNYGTGVWK